MPTAPRVWLSWHDAPRSRNLARLLGAAHHAYLGRADGALRHVCGTVWTVRTLARLRPRVVFLQNSFLLLLVVAAYRRLSRRGVAVIADCHNKSLKRSLSGPAGPLFGALKRWSFAAVDLVIVSNAAVVGPALLLNPRVAVLRDPLPREFLDLAADDGPPDGEPYVLVPCSFERDEPVGVILEAAARLADAGIPVVITGDPARLPNDARRRAAPGVRLAGWLPVAEYRRLLAGAAVVVALTTDRDCLMCAAYEAVAARRPLVVSDSPVLRACFGDAALYAPNTAAAVVARVAEALRPQRADRTEALAAFTDAFASEFAAVTGLLAAAAAAGGGD